MYKIQGWVEQGNTVVVTGGLDSTTLVQGSFPSVTVTVYLHGTSTLASLYSDDNTVPTPLGNPFTSNADGTFGFYAASGRYDIVFSGGNLPAPYTLPDVTNGAGGGTGDVIGPSGATAGDIAVFSGSSGKIILDSGYSGSTFVLRPTTAIGGHIAVFDSGGGGGGAANAKIRDGGTGITSLMTGPNSATDGNLAVFNGGSGKIVRDGGAPSGGFIQYSQVARVAGDLTTSSATFVDATSMSVTITTGARRCLVNVIALMNLSAIAYITLLIDGVNQGGTAGLGAGASGTQSSAGFTFMTGVLSAGSHTFKLQWRSTSGSQTLFASSVAPLILGVAETNLTS